MSHRKHNNIWLERAANGLLVIFLIALCVWVFLGCATNSKAVQQEIQELNLSVEALRFYTGILIELGDAVDILANDSIPVELRMQLYTLAVQVLEAKVDKFEATRLIRK